MSDLGDLHLKLDQARGVTQLLAHYLNTGADPGELPLDSIVDAIGVLLGEVEGAVDEIERVK